MTIVVKSIQKNMTEFISPTTPEQLVGIIVKAAGEEDWDTVDEIAPLAEGMFPEQLMTLLKPHVLSPNDNVRDAAMTLWSFLDLRKAVFSQAQRIHFKTALKVMKEDLHECAAIWAAVTVARYADDEKFGVVACESLSGFRKRIKKMDEKEGGSDWKETKKYIVGKAKERVPRLENLI